MKNSFPATLPPISQPAATGLELELRPPIPSTPDELMRCNCREVGCGVFGRQRRLYLRPGQNFEDLQLKLEARDRRPRIQRLRHRVGGLCQRDARRQTVGINQIRRSVRRDLVV